MENVSQFQLGTKVQVNHKAENRKYWLMYGEIVEIEDNDFTRMYTDEPILYTVMFSDGLREDFYAKELNLVITLNK